MKIFLIVAFFMSRSVFALEIDEKLTVRILRTSETRKTVMLNRGTEDGLVEGDHAKFITTAGIVARGVVVRVSPARSVWSLYRLVNADFIVNDAVMTVKMTPPVKITKDETKTLVREDTPTAIGRGDVAPIGIPLADGAQDLETVSGPLSDEADLREVDSEAPSIIPEKNIEAFGFIHISGLTTNTQTDTGEDSFNNSQSFHHIGLGAELYSQKEREWYAKFSLQASLNFLRTSSQAYTGATSENDVTEVSVGINWHPTKLPSLTYNFIPYLHTSVSMGTVSSAFSPGIEASGSGRNLAANGSTQGFAVGFGYKYYTPQGFGARVIADYYIRTETYEEDINFNKFNKTVGGPRLMVGLGYRF